MKNNKKINLSLYKDRYETYERIDGRYYFMGWYEIDSRFVDDVRIVNRNNKCFLYIEHLWLSGDRSYEKYIIS